MKWVYNDGGRGRYFSAENVGDCATRAIAIATGMDYKEVYDRLGEKQKSVGKVKSARNGVTRDNYKALMRELGWKWHPTMGIGQGCTVHLRAEELPAGRLVVQVSKHVVAVIDGTIHDTYDPSRDGSRCVYGYWTPPEPMTQVVFMKRFRNVER